MNVAVEDAVVLTALAEDHRILADVGDLTALNGAVAGPRCIDSRAQVNRCLAVQVGFLRGAVPLGVLEGQAVEGDIAHRQADLRVSAELHEVLDARRYHVGRGHVLALNRPVVQDARLPVQIPLAGAIQGLEVVLQMVAFLAVPVSDGPAAAVGEQDFVRLFAQLLDPVQRGRPGVVQDDLHVVEVVPALNVARRVLEAQLVAAVAAGLGAIRQRLEGVGDAQVAVVGGSCARAALSVHEELLEVPVAVLHFLDLRRPQFALALLPAADLRAAGEYGLLAGVGCVYRRRILSPGVFRGQDDGCIEAVDSASELDGQRPVRDIGPQGPSCILRSVEGRQRAVGAVCIRCSEFPRPGVIPLGRDIQIRALLRTQTTGKHETHRGHRGHLGSKSHGTPPPVRETRGHRPHH